MIFGQKVKALLWAHLGIGVNGHQAVVDAQDHGEQALGGLGLGLGLAPHPAGPGVEVRCRRVVLGVVLLGAAGVVWERGTDRGQCLQGTLRYRR